MPPTETPSHVPNSPKKGAAGPTVGIIIIVLILMLGALYFTTTGLNSNNDDQQLPFIPGDATSTY